MATKYAVRMALCIECSPAIRFPAETQYSQLLYAKDVDGSGQASTVYTSNIRDASKSRDSREHNNIIFLNLHGNTSEIAGEKK